MGLTNAEYQRRWRAKHKAESSKHLKQLSLARAARKHQSGYGDKSPGLSDRERSQCRWDDEDAAKTHYEPTESEHQYEATRADDEDMCKLTAGRSPEKREKDVLRYLALCVDCPTAFRHAIDTVPESTIRRICDAVLNATEGDARHKLTREQRRLCDKYKRSIDTPLDVKKSLKAKRSLLRSANKQAGGSVFVPLMLQAALDTFGSALIPPKQ